MRIAIDLDGVLYDFQGAYRYMVREYRRVEMPPVEEFWTEWDSPDQYTSEKDREWMWSRGVKEGLFRYGHVIRGGIVGVRQLARLGHKLIVITHRPREAFKDTIDWLSYVQLPFSEVHILSDGQPKSSVAAHLLIDDKIENVEGWTADVKRHAVLFQQPWNDKLLASPRVTIVKGWPAVVEAVREMG